MERFQHVLLGVWQEACRHIDISQSTANIAPMLVRHLPVEQVLVRRIDTARSCLETVAVGLAGRKHPCPTPEPIARRTNWNRCWRGAAGKRWRIAGDVESAMTDLAGIVFGRLDGDALAGPLGDPAGIAACWFFWPLPTSPFTPEHAELAQLLLEPFSWRWKTTCRCGRWPR